MIEIPFSPIIFQAGSLVLSWHGIFSVLAVALGVFLAGRWAPKYGISKDSLYELAIWALIAAVIGARLVAILDDLEFYAGNPLQVFAFWRGGIAIWGGVLGGLAGGVLYARKAKLPVARMADVIAPALVLALIVGRFGDIVNGEHCAEITSSFWGFIYTHSTSPAFFCFDTIPSPPMHPAVVYEMLWNGLIFAGLWWGLKDRIRPEGMLLASFFALYATGRFFIGFYHHTYADYLGDLNQLQLISIAVLLVTVPLLGLKARIGARVPPDYPLPPASPSRPRGERRRRAARQARRASHQSPESSD
jgi:phosphatidylglycerol:prolipoprotein diacylglycerol transferase